MITYVSLYMLLTHSAYPFAVIHRGGYIRIYNLTKASAWRMAFACQRSGGRFTVSGQGWSWRRGKK